MNKINDYYLNSNLKINAYKFKIIFIRLSHYSLSSWDKKNEKDFKLEIGNKLIGIKEEIDHLLE